MKTCLWMMLVLWAATAAQATPFVVSDPYPLASTPQPTHCGVQLDAVPKAEIAVTAGPSGVYCKYDVGTVATGSHTIKLSHIYRNPVDPWADLESAQSPPFTFLRPAAPGAPTGAALIK